MILITLIGGIVSIIGIFYFYKGLSRQTSFLVCNSRLLTKLINVSPGFIACLIGIFIIYFSLNFTEKYQFGNTTIGIFNDKRTKQEILNSEIDIFNDKRTKQEILNDWLSKLGELSCERTYSELFRNIFYTAQFRAFNFLLEKDITLGDLSKEKLGDSKYWQLIAIVNKDRGYSDDCDFACDSISEKTIIKKGCRIEVVAPSQYRYSRPVRTYKDFYQMRASSLISFYDFLLNCAINSKPFDERFLKEVTQKAIDEELSLTLRYFNSDGDTTLSELSSFYYEDNKYWEIIKWANEDNLPEDIKKRDILPLNQTILIPFFLP